jgi:hypothetical protein
MPEAQQGGLRTSPMPTAPSPPTQPRATVSNTERSPPASRSTSSPPSKAAALASVVQDLDERSSNPRPPKHRRGRAEAGRGGLPRHRMLGPTPRCRGLRPFRRPRGPAGKSLPPSLPGLPGFVGGSLRGRRGEGGRVGKATTGVRVSVP